MRDITLIPETSTTRKVTFRVDGNGVYLLFWQRSRFFNEMSAGISFQWYKKGPQYTVPGFSFFSYEEPIYTIVRSINGFTVYPSYTTCMDFEFDHDGNYIGQRQPNAYGPGMIFFPATIINGIPHVNGIPVRPLTKTEMAQAKTETY